MAKQNPDLEGYPAPAQSWPGSGNKGTPTQSGWGSEKIAARSAGFIELILRQVVLALTNALNPGSAFNQLKDWADEVGDGVKAAIKAFTGINMNQTPAEVWHDIIEGLMKPLNLLAELIDGKVPSLQIPILDPTKILNLPGLFAGFQGVLNGIKRGWSGVPDAVGSVEDVEVILGAARQVQFGLITLADLANAPENAPFWESPNPFEDVSFPRRDLQPVTSAALETATMSDSGTTLGLASSWGGATTAAVNNHKHNIAQTTSKPLYTIPDGTLALSVVRLKKNRIANMVRFMAGGDTPTGAVHVGLYEIDPLTGGMTKVYDFGDISSEVDTGPLIYECALEMTEDMVFDAGALYAVGILPLGGSFSVAAIPRQRSVPDPIIYPQGATELLSGQTALPASITELSLNHDATHCIWVSVGQTVPTTITPITLVITFDGYANNPNWSSPAVKNFRNNSSARWAIVDGKLRPDGPIQIAPIDYRLAFLALQRCATSNMFSEYVIGSGWTSAITAVGRCFVNCNAEGTEGVMLQVAQEGSDPATVTIETITGMVSSGTVQATNSAAVEASVTDVFRIEAVYDEDDGYTTYIGYRNGEPIPGVVWADTTGLVDVGTAWRRCGYGATAASFSNVVYRAASADVWRCGDLAVA